MRVRRRAMLLGFLALLVRPMRARAQHHPTPTRVWPHRGPPGTRVTFVGEDFVPGTVVYLDSLPLPTVARTRRRMVVRIPPGARSGRLIVTLGDEEEVAGDFVVTAGSW